MIYNFGQTTSSHVPVLLEYIDKYAPRSVLEFGGGVFSTSIFSRHIDNITTIETHHEWAEYLRGRFNHKVIFLEKDMVMHHVEHIISRFDLVFIDTVNKLRRPLILSATKFTDTIICHDAQLPFLRKIRVVGFKRVDFKNPPFKYKNGLRPWTSLFTRDMKVYNYFVNYEESELYKKHRFPYGVEK